MAAVDLTRSFAPHYAASKWVTIWSAMFEMAAQRSRNAPGPPLTNAEVTAFVREWRAVSGASSHLWYQFAALAYGWNPPGRDYMRRDPAQARAMYPVDDVVDVWMWAKGIADELDARNDGQPPRISIDRDTFTDPTFYGAVTAALRDDGARAAWRFPTGFCIDRDGKRRAPQVPCDKHGRGPIVGRRKDGSPIYGPCDKPGDCTPELLDDPLTTAANAIGSALLMLGALYLLTRNTRRNRR